MSFAFRQMLHDVTRHDRGGKRKPMAEAVVPGTIDTSCANTSVPAERAQSYREKNGSASPLTGDRRTDAAHAIRSTLNGPISSHHALNVTGAMRMSLP